MQQDTAKICGSIGCHNDADGVIKHRGRIVWTCKRCAGNRELMEIDG